MKTVTREGLAAAAHTAAPWVDQKDERRLVDEVFETISATMVDGEVVKISMFGVFVPINSPARMGRNPNRPEEEYPIPACRRVAFRPAFELNRKVAPHHPGRSVAGRGYLR
jgi:nucleoid DNA-binding protein